MLHSPEQKFLKLLGISSQPPSLPFLRDLVRAHLAVVPYENISKLVRVPTSQFSIPSFENYVEAISEFSFGGTCFSQNLHFAHLLSALGFEVHWVRVLRETISHVCLRVHLEGNNYFVDLGLMSTVAGPHLLAPNAHFETFWNEQLHVFQPHQDHENFSLEIHRGGKLIRTIQSTSVPLSQTELIDAIKRTFEPTAIFMKALCTLRMYNDEALGIWNKTLYKCKGTATQTRQIENLADLKKVFAEDFSLPKYPIEEALEVLKFHGKLDLFTD